MSEHTNHTTNIVKENGKIGAQAGEIKNSNIIMNDYAEYSPEEKYEAAEKLLKEGVPRKARDLIDDAISKGHDGARVRFHRVLAILSKRSYRDLTAEDREQMRLSTKSPHEHTDDSWSGALDAIRELFEHFENPDISTRHTDKKLRDLPSQQHEKIMRHLDLFITSELKDVLWTETSDEAREGRFSGDRSNRVWAYFQPDPLDARVRHPAEDPLLPYDRRWAIVTSCTGTAAVGYLGWLVLTHATVLPVLAYLAMLAFGYVASRNGFEWHYRTSRLKLKEGDFFRSTSVTGSDPDGFANQVDRSFSHYFHKYCPENTNREKWLAETAGIRATLRDEIVELYRESRTGVGRVNWLIRYLTSDVKQRWRAGTLLRHRERYRVATSTKVRFSLALAALVPTTLIVLVTTVTTSVLPAALAALVAVPSTRDAVKRWLRVAVERRRFEEDQRESDRLHQERHEAYLRWRRKLETTCPSEIEMEYWLHCDKVIMLDDALRHYRLAWRDIITHAFLQTPTSDAKRKRRGGPLRFSKYDVRLFLITRDGVRETNTTLDFEQGLFGRAQRGNFRFDAISSTDIIPSSGLGYTLKITLINGPTREVNVKEPDQEASTTNPNDTSERLSEIDLDAAGFTHTRHVLEGIAAEGKGWIERDPVTSDVGFTSSTDE
ncbi:hypothetical protein IL38_12110 [Actinopolyspora erythraea]|uniref:DUF2207 domain-containing protein n=2 Tax=Actinopolyspora erythraea TaxID=414996 RepID=A0ABR4X3Z0_9ACTN|nr:hypothetical protein IL38_12110 [Actinopolyspora erythraea]